jgi:hypothetical protein
MIEYGANFRILHVHGPDAKLLVADQPLIVRGLPLLVRCKMVQSLSGASQARHRGGVRNGSEWNFFPGVCVCLPLLRGLARPVLRSPLNPIRRFAMDAVTQLPPRVRLALAELEEGSPPAALGWTDFKANGSQSDAILLIGR